MSVYTGAMTVQKRRQFISEMNRKWQKKHKREQAWLDQIEAGNF